MSDMVGFEGWDELIDNLSAMAELPDQTLIEAAQAGAAPIAEEANRLAHSPVVVVDVKVTRQGVQARIGPDKEHWHYRFYEYGATQHEISGKPLLIFQGEQGMVWATKVVAAGGLAAQPFLRPALDSQAEKATQAMLQYLLGAVRSKNGGS